MTVILIETLSGGHPDFLLDVVLDPEPQLYAGPGDILVGEVISGLEGWVKSEHTGLLAEAQHSLLLLLLGLVGVLSCHLTLGQH